MIKPELRPAYEIAYNTYVAIKAQYNNVSDSCQKRFRRQIEATVGEAGFGGTNTGLISKSALETHVNEKKGIAPTRHSRKATEHPITPRVIADFILAQDRVLDFDEYFAVWFDNYVYTITTNDENQHLKKFQAEFKFGDCWKTMYEAAGIELVQFPNFRLKAVKQEYGII